MCSIMPHFLKPAPDLRIGSDANYVLTRQHLSLVETWYAEGPHGECHVRILPPEGWLDLSEDRKKRESNTVLRELNRWRNVTVARPKLREIFWEENTLIWIESVIEGAPLSSLSHNLSLNEGMSLIEEGLCALDLIHSERDFQLGEPLLHLNINPHTIWRGISGELYLMHPLSPTLIELKGRRTLSDEEALSGRVAPELLRGRYGMSSDLYGLAMSAISAMTGMSVDRVDERLQAERLFIHDLPAPKPIIDFLTQMTAFRASARFQSAREALSAFARLPEVPPPQVSPPLAAHEKNTSPSLDPLMLPDLNSDEEPRSSPPTFYTLADQRQVGVSAALRLENLNMNQDAIFVDAVVEPEHKPHQQTLYFLIGVLCLSLLMWLFRDDHSDTQLVVTAPRSSTSPHSPPPDLEESTAQEQQVIIRSSSLPPSLGPTDPEWIKIPSGFAFVGSPPEEGYLSEQPMRHVHVLAFEVSKTEVTVLQYAQCIAQGVCTSEGLKTPDLGNAELCNWDRVGRSSHPINCISWYQANVYAQWAGGRLLSEVEWSHMAQSGSAERRIYPWGSEPASCERAVLADFVKGAGCGLEHTAPACSKPLGKSAQGVCDIIGNVWEWVQDEWHEDYHGAPSNGGPWVSEDPLKWRSSERVYRGGGAFDERDLPRIARRGHRPPTTRLFNLGFRIARDLEGARVNLAPIPERVTEPLPKSTPSEPSSKSGAEALSD